MNGNIDGTLRRVCLTESLCFCMWNISIRLDGFERLNSNARLNRRDFFCNVSAKELHPTVRSAPESFFFSRYITHSCRPPMVLPPPKTGCWLGP